MDTQKGMPKFSIFEVARTLACVHNKVLIFETIQNRGLLEASLKNNNLSIFLLTEQGDDGPKFSDADANELNDSVKAVKLGIKSVTDALGASGKFPKTLAALTGLVRDVPEVGDIAKLAIVGDSKALRQQIEDVNSTISNASQAAASVMEAALKFVTSLAPVLEKIPEPDRGKTLEALSEKYAEDPDVKFPDLASLKMGAKKAAVLPGWFKQAWKSGMDAAKEESGGFFGKVGAFFKSLFDTNVTATATRDFADEVVTCTIPELKEIAGDLGAAKDAFQGSVQDASAASTEAQAGAEQASSPEGETSTGEDTTLEPEDLTAADEAADELADALGAGPISKKELTALLKKYPEVTGKGNKATYQRRIFRKAVNQAAGKEVFEEALLIGSKTTKSDDSEMFDRWKTLAGIGE